MKIFKLFAVITGVCISWHLTFGQDLSTEVDSPEGSAAIDSSAESGGLNSQTTIGARYSSDVQEYFGDILVSPWSSDNVALLLNLRGSFLEGEEQEVNAGVILRRITDNKKLIYGANLYYDSRWTDEDNQFGQVGGGIELLTGLVDFRANFYVPTDDEEELSVELKTDSSSAIAGGSRVTTTTTKAFTVYEEALEGYDVELGLWIPFISDFIPTAVLGGYYDFSSDFGEDISGARVRLESRLCSYFTFDAEWFEDDELNQTDYFVGFRIHLPTGKALDAETDLEKRLYDMVNRDFRIRTRITGPIESIAFLGETSARLSAPVSLPPTCRLDSEGDVVCEVDTDVTQTRVINTSMF